MDVVGRKLKRNKRTSVYRLGFVNTNRIKKEKNGEGGVSKVVKCERVKKKV